MKCVFLLVVSFVKVRTDTTGDIYSPFHQWYDQWYGGPALDAATDLDPRYCQPEQIHISFGEKINDIVITWMTEVDPGQTRVQFGANGMLEERKGDHKMVEDLRRQYVHRVTLRDLEFNTTYEYRCGSDWGWSERFTFTTLPRRVDHLRVVFYGDMGVENARALPYLQQEAEDRRIDFVLHVGDFAYDMHEEDSRQGDQFMRQMQPIAALVPYMTAVGNHEENKNFTQYKNRMTMPGYQQHYSMFYSWDVGPVHFVALDTEAYYFYDWYGTGQLASQFNWLRDDLEKANAKENRTQRPWVIIYGHRPMYCSEENDIEDCNNELTRVGVKLGNCSRFALEPLLMQYGVDIVVWAHEHTYERTWPMFDYRVLNGSISEPYKNPRAPVHILSGSAGCREKPDPLTPIKPDWAAFRSRDYGYTRMKIYNATHIYFEQVSVEHEPQVIDSFWVEQHRHAPFPYKQRLDPTCDHHLVTSL